MREEGLPLAVEQSTSDGAPFVVSAKPQNARGEGALECARGVLRFLDDPEVALHAVEPLGKSAQLGQHAATLTFGRPGTLHEAWSVVLQEDNGGPAAVTSIASGLAYPGVGPEIAMLCTSGRLSVDTVSDAEAVGAFLRISRSEGFIPALESAHALAFAIRLAVNRPPTERILVNLSGRGDKDVDFVLARHNGSESRWG